MERRHNTHLAVRALHRSSRDALSEWLRELTAPVGCRQPED
jgi:hypothetical protein